MNEVVTNSYFKEAEELAKPIKYLGSTFLAAIIANSIFIGLFRDSPLFYAVIPFNIAYIFNVAWLAKVTYGWVMAIMAFLLGLFPVGAFLIMLLALSRALKRIKDFGYKTGFTGSLVAYENNHEIMIRREGQLRQNESQNPRSNSTTIFLIVAVIVGVIGLFIYGFISGLADGFAHS